MSTSVINIKTDSEVKKEAKKIAAELGLTLSGVLNAYLRQFIRNKEVSFSLGVRASDYLSSALEESEKNIIEGDVYAFPDSKKALDFLDKV